jgi:hypothetical protein
MATYTDRLLLVVDAATKAAQGQLGSLQKSLGQTDTASQKATRSTSALGKGWDALRSSGLLAAVSVAGVAQQVLKAAQAWTTLGKDVTDTSDALGISTEEASRWIAVADDYEVSSDKMTAALLRVGRAAAGSGETLTDLGIAIDRTDTGAVDLTGTAENIADGLSRIQDPAARAAAGTKIFGKAWADLAPVFSKTGAELDGMLAGVSDAQVLTAEEAESAEDLRLAQDRLNDSLGDLQLELGKATAKMAPLIEHLAQALELVGKLNTEMQDRAGFDLFTNAIDLPLQLLKNMREGRNPFEKVNDGLKDGTPLAQAYAKQIATVAQATADAAAGTGELTDQLDELRDGIDMEREALDLADAFDDITAAAQEAWGAAAGGAADAAAKGRDYERAILKAKDQALDFMETLGDVPAEKQVEILTLIDQGDYRAAQVKLNALAAPIRTTVVIAGVTLEKGVRYVQGQGWVPSGVAAARSGGPAAATPAARGAPAPAAAAPTVMIPAARPLIVNITAGVIGDPGAVEQAVVSAQRRYDRINGPRASAWPARVGS